MKLFERRLSVLVAMSATAVALAQGGAAAVEGGARLWTEEAAMWNRWGLTPRGILERRFGHPERES